MERTEPKSSRKREGDNAEGAACGVADVVGSLKVSNPYVGVRVLVTHGSPSLRVRVGYRQRFDNLPAANVAPPSTRTAATTPALTVPELSLGSP